MDLDGMSAWEAESWSTEVNHLKYRSLPQQVTKEKGQMGHLLLRLDGGEKKCGKMYKWMIAKNG